MGDDDRAHSDGQPDEGNVVISSSALPGRLGSVNGTLEGYQQYYDIALIATLQDHVHAGKALELNERPAFPHSPSKVARLLPAKNKEGLITYVMDKYA